MKKIFKDISVYTVGDILTKGIGFAAIILYSHLMPPKEMGVYGYAAIIIGFINTFVILGLDNAYARYFFEYKQTDQRGMLTSTVMLFLVGWSVVIIIIPTLFSQSLAASFLGDSKYAYVVLLALWSIPTRILSSITNQALRNQFRTREFVLYNFFTAFVTLSSAFLFLKYSSLGVAGIFAGMIIGDIVVLPFRLYSILPLLLNHIELSILWKLLRFGIPYLPASIAYWVFSSADRVMLESMSGLKSVGIYTVAVSLSAVMSILAGAIGQAWSPHAVKMYEEDPEEAKRTYWRFLRILIALALLVILIASLIGREVISALFPDEYAKTFLPFLFLLTAIGLQITTQVTAVGIGLKKKTMYLVYITGVVALVNIGLNYILIPLFSETGASAATMLSYGILTLLYAMVSQRLFPISYNKKEIVMAGGGAVMCLLAAGLPMAIRYASLIGILLLMFLKRRKIVEVIL